MTTIYEIETADFAVSPVTYYYRAISTDEQTALDLAAEVRGYFRHEGGDRYVVRFSTNTRIENSGPLEVVHRFEVK